MYLKLFLANIALILVISSCGEPEKNNNNDKPDRSGDQQPKPEPKPEPKPGPKPGPDFNKVVEPTLASIQKDLINVFCISCHQGATPSAKLDLTDISQYMQGQHGIGGYHGILINPGKARESMLVMITKTTNPNQKMPPVDSVYPAFNQQQLAAVAKWIDSLPPIAGGDDEPDGGDTGGTDEPGTTDGGGTDEPGRDDGHTDHDH